MSNKHLKKYSTSLSVREMQVRSALIFHLTPVRTTAREDVEQVECSSTAGGNTNLYNQFGNQYGSFKKLGINSFFKKIEELIYRYLQSLQNFNNADNAGGTYNARKYNCSDQKRQSSSECIPAGYPKPIPSPENIHTNKMKKI